MSTQSPEKDSLLGPTVHEKIAYQNLKRDIFFWPPFSSSSSSSTSIVGHGDNCGNSSIGHFSVKPIINATKLHHH